jgi:hypothetical protein
LLTWSGGNAFGFWVTTTLAAVLVPEALLLVLAEC